MRLKILKIDKSKTVHLVFDYKYKMTDEVGPEVIKKTQKTLGKHIKKPQLTEKLLKKPPFRFLHDVVRAVINETGFLKGLYSDEELISDNVKEKDAKIVFLNKLIEATKSLSQTNLSVKASRIVAGLEPTNTNLLLQTVASLIDTKVDGSQYISQLKHDNKSEKPKKSSTLKQEKSKSVVKSSNKDEKTTKSSMKSTIKRSTSIETPKSKLDTPKGSKGKISSRKEDDTKQHKTGRRGREEKKEIKDTKKSPKTMDSPKLEESPKTDSLKKETITKQNLFPAELKNKEETLEKKNGTKTEHTRRSSYTIDKKDIVLNDKTDNSAEENKEFETQKESTIETPASNEKDLANVLNERAVEATEESSKSLVRPKSARPKSGEMKINSASKEEKSSNEQASKLQETDHAPLKPFVPKSSLRPPSVRPSSARPGAPRLRPDSALPHDEPIAMGNINVIVERVDTTAVDEEETVVIETAPIEPEVISEVTVELDNKGHLVEQILEQLEEGEGKKRTEIDWEPDVAARTKEGTIRDVTQLAGSVQSLSKATTPLGKLINYLNEDVDAMHTELQMWINTKQQLYAEIRKQKRSNVESNKPLLATLEELQQEIKKAQQEITQMNSVILKNDARIKELSYK